MTEVPEEMEGVMAEAGVETAEVEAAADCVAEGSEDWDSVVRWPNWGCT